MSAAEAEVADVVVVGARCAGSATATAFARAGKKVVVLDRVAFPADTISTHLLWPSGLAELKALGALDRVHALGAPRMPVAYAAAAGHVIQAGYTPVDGIDYAMCVRRTGARRRAGGHRPGSRCRPARARTGDRSDLGRRPRGGRALGGRRRPRP